MPATKIAGEFYRLTLDGEFSKIADISTASAWVDIFKYQVPVDKQYSFKPGHTFAAYLADTGTTELSGTSTKIRVELRDANQQMRYNLLQDKLYAQVKEFQDRTKICRLDITEEKRATPGMWIYIVGYTATTMDKDLSYFELTCERSRITVI